MIPGVPYDAEIEYLESTGTQWIDTEILPNQDIGIFIDFLCVPIVPTPSFYVLFEARRAYHNADFGIINFTGRDNQLQFRYGNHDRYTQPQLAANTRHTIKTIQNILYVDEVQKITCNINSFYTPVPICICAANNDGSVTTSSALQIFNFRISFNSTLVRDFIPVRVGQTGYMYDRVTKRLFGNKGTGSFVLGPDVAKPVMGLWGMREVTFPTDYIQDGLVAHFDAICNGPNGEHVVNTEKWYDLTGNERYLNTWGKLVPRWEDNYVWNYRGYFQNPSVNRDYTENGLTEEYVTYAGWANGGNDVNLGMGLVRNNWLNLSNNAYRFGVFGQYPYTGYSADLIQSTMRKCIAFSVRPDGIGTLYVDGGAITLPMSTLAHPYTKLSGSYNIGVGKNNNGIYQKGVHAYRIYNRALSAAEIAHNYAIDKARFNLP